MQPSFLFPNVNPPARNKVQIQKRKIRQSLFRVIYIWHKNGTGFWAWIAEKNCMYINGYKWNGHNWVKFRMSLNSISDFKEL